MMEPREIVISKEDVGVRVTRRVQEDDDGNESPENGVSIEETRAEETLQSIWVGDKEIPKLIKALKQLT